METKVKEKVGIVINNENLRNELRNKGFENVKRFSWEKSAKKIIEIIEDLR